jgi:CRISPR-associated protein Csd1
LNKLYDTYENCESLVGKEEANKKTPLLPVAHSTQNAQIEVTLDSHGNFVSARILDKKDAVTIIPVTEDSASRGAGINPHPLCDKLQYIAGDYGKYVGGKKPEEYYGKYISQLEAWCGSPYSNRKAAAILAYLKKGCLISELVEQGILVCTNDQKLDPAVKIDVGSQCDAFVRFKVIEAGDIQPCVWKDKQLWESYIRYYRESQGTKELCYSSGAETVCSEKHPAKIRMTADKAKLISGNDDYGFTYRGRFSSKGQAVNVGYDVSQKAHNALKWLIERQGYRNEEQAVVAWGTRDEKLPPVLEDTYELFPEEERIIPPSTSEEFAKRLTRAIAGYACDLDHSAQVVVMGVEAATTGRLSIIYYNELNGTDFLERLQYWHKSCIWRHTYKRVLDAVDEKGKEKFKYVSFTGAPSPKEIAYAAYGPNASGKLVKATVERLLPCIIDKAKIPSDLVKAAVSRARNPIAIEDFERQKVRSIACALVKKYREERFGEVWTMELDKTKDDIQYLFGRLLAVADEIESWALMEMKEERETNAIRLFERFAQNPAKTWGVIAKRLVPYQIKLGGKCKWLVDIRQDIAGMMEPDRFVKARNLDGRFILGFDCQKKDIRDERIRRKEAKANAKANADANKSDLQEEEREGNV